MSPLVSHTALRAGNDAAPSAEETAMLAFLPSLPAYIGLVLALWASAYVATRTSYAANTRLVRVVLICTGGWLLGTFLSEQAASSNEAMLWQLVTLPLATIAPSLWCLWTARNLPGIPHVPRSWRYLFLLPAALVTLLLATAITPVASPPFPTIAALPRRIPVDPLFMFVAMSAAGMLGVAASMIVRSLQVAAHTTGRRGLGLMLTGTLCTFAGGPGAAIWVRSDARLSAAAQLLLTAGALAIAYGTVIFTQRARRRVFRLDALSSGLAALGIAALLVLLVAVILALAADRALPFLVATLVTLSTLLIFYGDGLRMILDLLRISRARRLEIRLLRMMARRLAAPHVTPEQLLAETLAEIAHAIRADRLALVVPDAAGMRLAASYGATPEVLPSPEALRARRVRAYEQGGFSHSVPLLEDGMAQGLLLLGGWHQPNIAVHLYSELEFLGTILAVIVTHAYHAPRSPADAVITEDQLDTDQMWLDWRLNHFPQQQVLVRLLGGLRLEHNCQPLEIPKTSLGRKRFAHILAYLVLTRGSYSSLDTLHESVTSSRGADEEVGQRRSPGMRARLRQVFEREWKLPAGMVSWNDRQVRFEQNLIWQTDIELIEEHLLAAEEEDRAGESQRARRQFRAAHNLCGGRVLPEMDFLPEAEVHLRAWERRWAQTHKRLLRAYGDHLLRDGDPAHQPTILKLADELAAAYPEDEQALRVASRLAHGGGDLSSARLWTRKAQQLAEGEGDVPEGML